MRCFIKHCFFLGLLGLLTACIVQNYAPVDKAWSASEYKKGTYVVQPGDTLYAIAWRYDLDYRALAEENHIAPPYTVEVGQVLNVNPVVYKKTPVQTV